MHKNEAIARVAETAMTQIFDIAQFAISQITDNDRDLSPSADLYELVGERVQQVQQTLENEVTTNVTGKATTTRRTRANKPPKSETVAIEIGPEVDATEDFVDLGEAKVVSSNDDGSKVVVLGDNSFLGVSADDAEVEEDNSAFPNHPDDWFSEDVERARNACRSLLAKIVSKDGSDAARKSIMETTGKPRVTDFDADDCASFYRAFRNNV
jgi:hypothetical protein